MFQAKPLFVFVSIRILIMFAILNIAIPLYSSPASSSKSPQGSNSPAGSQSNTANSPNSGGASGPFESVMLAYGSLDRVVNAVANRTCNLVPGKGTTIVVLDQTSLANLAAYDAFVSTANVLTSAFGGSVTTQAPNGPGGAAGGPDMMADIVSAVSAVLVASNTETSSNFSIQDPSAALKLTMYLHTNADCTNAQVQVVYSNMIPTSDPTDLAALYDRLKNLADARAQALKASAANFSNLDQTYNLFLQSLFGTGTNGQPGLVPIIQGYNLRQLLSDKSKPTLSVVVSVAAAGGTQQIRKNLITALTTGEWIRYSGGVILNTIIIRSDTNQLLFSDVLRYRSPLATLHKPIGGKETKYGDNLGDTLAPGGISK